MNIVFLDGYTINPGDLTWQPLEALGNLTVYDRTEPDEVLQRAAGAEVLIVNKTCLTADHFEALKSLKLVCVAATGYDRIDTAAARRQGIVVCNCAGYSSLSVAQMVVSLLLEAFDSVGFYAEQNRRGAWSESPDFCYTVKPRVELAGKRMAIVGFGNIGRTVACIMQAFGMKLYAVSSKADHELPAEVHKISLEDAFATCDIVSLNCPLTAQNRGFVNASLLARANPRLVLVNTARGALVDEQEVAEALQQDRLGAYCTDVLTHEPPASDCPLLSVPNCYITPHIGWDTIEARRRILTILVDNIRAFQTGSPISVVN